MRPWYGNCMTVEVTEMPRCCSSAHPVGGRVARGLAALDGAGQLDRAAEQQQLLGERGLAGVGVRNDGEGAATRHFVERLIHPPDFTGIDSLRTNASSRPTSAW